MNRYKVNLIILIALASCATCLSGCLVAKELLLGSGDAVLEDVLPVQDSYVDIALSRVQIGNSRETAIQLFPDAWFHTECRHPGSDVVEDLFFYDKRSIKDVKIVLIESRKVGNTTIVSFIGSVESYMLHLYEYCVPTPLQAFQGDATSPTR